MTCLSKLKRQSATIAVSLLLTALPPIGSAVAEPRQAIVTQCAACHGEEGIARDIELPHLAGQNERYLFNQMMAFRSGKRPHQEMRFMARGMTVREIEALSAYYASLPR